jgi:hypothetical protein
MARLTLIAPVAPGGAKPAAPLPQPPPPMKIGYAVFGL